MAGYFGKTFTATLTGKRIVPVCCEKCRTEFIYELARIGTGQASAPYFLFQGAAQARAERAAQNDLHRRLERESELVPCPRCNWVNTDLVQRYRRRQYRRAPLLAAIWFFAVGLTAVLVAGNTLSTRGRLNESDRATLGFATLLAVVPPILVFVIRGMLRRRFDPNSNFPRPTPLPPGTPPALLEEQDAQTGEWFLRAAPRVQSIAEAPADWAVFRPGQVAFPPLCCVCMTDATTGYAPPFTVNSDSEVAVPLCASCSRGLKWKWWLFALMTFVGVVGIMGIVAMSVRADEVGKWILFSVGTLFGTAFGLAIVPAWWCRPYRLRAVDSDRGIVRFRAQNPAYTQLVARLARAADGME